MKNKISYIFMNAVPVILMVALIPVIKNDYILAAVYIFVIIAAFAIKKEPKDFTVFLFGLIVLTISESIFVSTGVETFNRISLFNLMPIWLPLLWAYGFVAIKRGVLAL